MLQTWPKHTPNTPQTHPTDCSLITHSVLTGHSLGSYSSLCSYKFKFRGSGDKKIGSWEGAWKQVSKYVDYGSTQGSLRRCLVYTKHNFSCFRSFLFFCTFWKQFLYHLGAHIPTILTLGVWGMILSLPEDIFCRKFM